MLFTSDQSAPASTIVYVGASKYGRGLFAARAIRRGEVVVTLPPHCVAFRMQSSSAHDLLERYVVHNGAPHDSILRFGRTLWWDPFVGSRESTWYFLNHSCRGNLRVIAQRRAALTLSRSQKLPIELKPEPHPNHEVAWIARRTVRAHEELLFDYGEPDPTWGDT